MKIHHLARHANVQQQQQQQQQFFSTQQDHSDRINHQQLDIIADSPVKQPHQELTDDEDEDIVEDYSNGQDQTSLYDQLINSNNQESNNQQQQMDSTNSSFLMDKNKKLFPQKLWELIHNPSIQHCLRWSQDGQRVYLNRNEFEAYYLKTPNNQFHTQKAISFVRQMNMYGFRKVDDCYYENDNFRRDRQHLLRNMIRRHPNKGLFVGHDQHQLAAVAAAQQALQVNQQFQQLEQQHKQRAEQALRLNDFLNQSQQHRFQLQQIGQRQQLLESHSSPFEHSLSSQLAQQLAASHLSAAAVAAQQNQIQKHNDDNLNLNLDNGHQVNNQNNHHQPVHHQPKKSRLLSDFYAAAAAAAAAANNHSNQNNSANNQLVLQNQDSMHSNSSVDTQPSQCSSVVNSGSAGSPQSSSPGVIHPRMQQHHQKNQNKQDDHSTSSIGAAVLAAAAAAAATAPQNPESISMQNHLAKCKFGLGRNGSDSGIINNQQIQHAATDLSNHQSRQAALHQTLVRSLLQLKQQQHQNPHDILVNLAQQPQHQTSRSLLESMASLSSAGTGSIVDPTSNSPTERTATPPSSPSSPSIGIDELDSRACYMDNGANLVLNLAKPASSQAYGVAKQLSCYEKANGSQIDNEEAAEVDGEEEATVDPDDSSLDGAKKVRRFLDAQMEQMLNRGFEGKDSSIKREYPIYKEDEKHIEEVRGKERNSKRVKLEHSIARSEDLAILTKSLIVGFVNRRGDKFDSQALDDAARYTQCFLSTLIQDAALIAGHPPMDYGSNGAELEDDQLQKDTTGISIIDSSSLSLALKLIPSKLIAAIQQQQPNVEVSQS